MNKIKWALQNSLINCMYAAFDEVEGCIEVNETYDNDSDKGMCTAVILDGHYVHTCIYANTEEGLVKRLKLKEGGFTTKIPQCADIEIDPETGKYVEETVYGDVLILLCSNKVLKLLHHIEE